MKRFRFTLQSLLTMRQQAEQAVLENYGRALAARDQARNRSNQAGEKLAQARLHLAAELSQGLTAERFVRHQWHQQQLQERWQQAEATARQAEQQADQAHQQLLAARKDLQMIEKLQERQQRAYRQAVAREEQKLIDDLANRRPEILQHAPVETARVTRPPTQGQAGSAGSPECALIPVCRK